MQGSSAPTRRFCFTPLVAWEEAELLLKRAWPSRDQPHEWESMRDDVHAGWLEAAAKIDCSSTLGK
jgi:hypothetical protein